jgi:hypothetical protein
MSIRFTRHGRIVDLSDPARPEIIDMTVDGRFVEPPRPAFATKLMVWAAVIAGLAVTVALGFLALWFALLAVPVAILGAGIAYAAWRFRLWQARR